MPASIQDKTPACEQCGAPLLASAWEEGCLNCLLSTGIEGEVAAGDFGPNEAKTRFYQHYEILARADGSFWELGRGAMGITYKARDTSLDTSVALKVINFRFSTRPEARRRFLHEAQAAAQLRHPNVASVFHFGTNGITEEGSQGDCFYAMEFVEGESLESRVQRTGPLAPVLALEMALQIARALAAAEQRGLVHRDLKPSNIMLATEEEEAAAAKAASKFHVGTWVKVIDFGLAKINHDEDAPGRFLGTVAFSSPEQREAREVDVRSDIYSLGATLWYSLTGKIPFTRSLAQGPREKESALPFNPLAEQKVPVAVIALLTSMLAYDPNDRPRSAAELVAALQECLRESVRGPQPHSRARRWAVLAGGLSATAALIALAVYLVPPTLPRDESLAVLPFRNLSTDPANAFLAEGVEDDILSRLVKIHG